MNRDIEGKIYKSNNYGEFKIIKYHNCYKVEVQFIKTGFITCTALNNIMSGRVKDWMYPHVYNVGYYGVGKYTSRDNNGVQYKYYKVWKEMLNRCYNPNCHGYSTYGAKGVIVCDEWHNFQNYAEWYLTNCLDDSFHVDKDILSGNSKIYSPETCCFVPRIINNVITIQRNKRTNLPPGIRLNYNKYEVSVTIHGTKTYIGLYDTKEEALSEYIKVKLKYIKELAEFYKLKLSENAYNALLNYSIDINDYLQ